MRLLLSVLGLACLVSCSSSTNGTPAGSSGGSSGSSGSSRPARVASTREQRSALCEATVGKCKSYPTVGGCINDQQTAAECFVTTALACVNALTTCRTDDYDACQAEGAHACDPDPLPPYVLDCKKKNDDCKATYSEDVWQAIDDSCVLLPAIEDSALARAATCVAGSCEALADCVTTITP